MKPRMIDVFLDVTGQPEQVGRLWFHDRGESTSFQYAPSWLQAPYRFAIDPDLPLPGATLPGAALPGAALSDHPLSQTVFHSPRLFGCFSDAAPDRWGQMLMRRANAHTLSTADYLLGVDDGLRMGAFRFREPGGGFLAPPSTVRIPPLTELPRLVAAAQRLEQGNDSLDDIRLLLRPGASMGGAHPKAVVSDTDDSLWLAKFPGVLPEDRYRPHWEALAVTLAQQSGIQVPEHRLLNLSPQVSVFLTRRFDRTESGHRVHYASAMTLLGATDGETRSYEEMAEALREKEAPPTDVQELWRRIAFSVLISNVDDHLRNHGVLWSRESGFRLTPAFDLNPADDRTPRNVFGTALRENGPTQRSFSEVWDAARDFFVPETQARAMVRTMAEVIHSWSAVAKTLKIPSQEATRRIASFQHTDLRDALYIGSVQVPGWEPSAKPKPR
ncbi:MAG: type II toxin-antitoxin system HipA family toxin [Acidithiobacillus sp.]|nr:type II toxin-antitoxin system HipA family toxin [Acidithiobacillus sp.]